MHQTYLRTLVCLALGSGLALSQEQLPQSITAEEPSSWVARLWSSLFGTPTVVVPVALYLPPPPPPPCLVTPLSPVEDELALAFEQGSGTMGRVYLDGLTRPTARALARFDLLVSAAGGDLTVTSPHRPATYQLHLQQVWDKWMEVRDLYEPECESTRAEAEREFYSHGLLEAQRPASFSDHTRGTAFDAAVQLPPRPRLKRRRVNVDTLARMAGLFRPVMWSDPVHFRLRGRY